jgi:hypothetical protein
VKFHGSPFGERPEPFKAIDMFFLTGKFILSLMDTIVFFVSQVNKAIVTVSGVRMDDSFRGSTLPGIMASKVFRVHSFLIEACQKRHTNTFMSVFWRQIVSAITMSM